MNGKAIGAWILFVISFLSFMVTYVWDPNPLYMFPTIIFSIIGLGLGESAWKHKRSKVGLIGGIMSILVGFACLVIMFLGVADIVEVPLF